MSTRPIAEYERHRKPAQESGPIPDASAWSLQRPGRVHFYERPPGGLKICSNCVCLSVTSNPPFRTSIALCADA